MREGVQSSYRALRSAIQAFVAGHDHRDMQRFKAAVAAWGAPWHDVAPHRLSPARYLSLALTQTTPQTHPLVTVLEAHADNVRWERTYSAGDGVISADMLEGYGFVEVIGAHGPYVSTAVRCGIGIYPPGFVYPAHHHQAEEIYVVLAGGACFHLDGAQARDCGPGDVVHVRSSLPHGYDIGREALVVFYIWQAGDLREVSTFV